MAPRSSPADPPVVPFLRTVAAALLLIGLVASSPASADEQAAAHDSHPADAVALDGLVAEATLLVVALRDCDGEVCMDLRAHAAILVNLFGGLWPIVGAGEVQRPVLDLAWKDIENEVLWLDVYVPQAAVADADALMREWVGTRERIDRFRRTLRDRATGQGPTARR